MAEKLPEASTGIKGLMPSSSLKRIVLPEGKTVRIAPIYSTFVLGFVSDHGYSFSFVITSQSEEATPFIRIISGTKRNLLKFYKKDGYVYLKIESGFSATPSITLFSPTTSIDFRIVDEDVTDGTLINLKSFATS